MSDVRFLRKPALFAVALAATVALLPACGQAAPTPATQLASQPAPIPSKEIYSPTADAHADLKAALADARKTRKNIILDFGGNWCGDCQVLDIYIHQQPNAGLVARNFEVVHVDIGRYDKNLDIAETYKVPLKKGVPALAVLNSAGKTLYVQQTGEFENMRNMDPASVTAFLTKWKPSR